jgi:perosamine synthetase
MTRSIPYGRQDITTADSKAVHDVLQSSNLTCGPQIAAFEEKLCEVTGAHHAVACSNGTAALHLACMALDIGPRSLAVTSPITFLASANCIEFCGGSVDFVDIERETLSLSPAALRRYCREVRVPDVVVAVDYAGVTADLPAVHALGREYGFKVIEDAAHSLGSAYSCKGRSYQAAGCAHADLAILSFHPVKTITTGEGGAVLTHNDGYAEKLRALRSHGMVRDPAKMSRFDGPWYYEMQSLGFNYRLTDLQCALGRSQLARLQEYKQRRQAIVHRYNAAFAELKGEIELPPRPEGSSPCYHIYPVQFTRGEQVRAAVYAELLKQGIQTQVHYIPVYWQPYYSNKYGFPRGKCPEAERYYAGTLSLPLFPAMTDEEVDRVISSVHQALLTIPASVHRRERI